MEGHNSVKIQRAGPGAPKFYPVKQKAFFKDVVEMFQNLSVPTTPGVAEPTQNRGPYQGKHAPSCGNPTETSASGKSKRVVALWLQLFSEILEDEQLTGKLRNTLKLLMGASGDSNEEVVVNLPERRTDRVKRITRE